MKLGSPFEFEPRHGLRPATQMLRERAILFDDLLVVMTASDMLRGPRAWQTAPRAAQAWVELGIAEAFINGAS